MAENGLPAAGSQTKQSHARVLIVDDEPDVVKMLSLHLGSEGYVVDTAYDGLEALEKISKSQPDVIILDLMMPKVDGSVVCLSVKHTSATRNIKIIILTARTQNKDKIEELGRMEADLYMTKPFEIDELSQNIETVLASAAVDPESTVGPHFSDKNL